MKQLEDMVLADLREMANWPPLRIEMSPLVAYMLIGQVQLAFRHPQNQSRSQQEIHRFIEFLRAQICKPGSPIDITIQMGYDPAHDVAGERPCAEGYDYPRESYSRDDPPN